MPRSGPAMRVALPSGAHGGFTLIEILIALGIMAFGLSVAIGLFAMGATTHKRATDKVNTALLGQSVIADIASQINLRFDETKLDPLPETREKEAEGPVYVLRERAEHPDYPDYRFSVYLTPLDDPPPASAFLCEVHLFWSEKGDRKNVVYRTVLIRKVSIRDFE